MAAANSLLSEDRFLCSICLDVFSDPVTIPCGHNFCRTCIKGYWDVNVLSKCPLCKEPFDRRPELRVNTFISEMAADFRQSVLKEASSSSSSEVQCAKPGDVLCDFCSETKAKALKSCLVCLASYCETHLETHRRITGLKRHNLIDPMENLEARVCKNHDRPLELFCKTDQTCMCRFCAESSHKYHRAVPLLEEYEGRKAELGKMEADVQQMIRGRQLKIRELKQSVELSKVDAARETEAGVQVFTTLMQLVERSLAEVIEAIKEKQETTEIRAEVFIAVLEEEISELMKRSSELEQLSHIEDPLQLLQGFPPPNATPPTNDWTEVRVQSSYEETVRTALAQLEEVLGTEMKRLCTAAELKRVRRFAVDVTLDPQTANHYLILSDDGKRVSRGDVKQNLPNSPKRFSSSCVLGKPGLSSGRFYYEVQVEGKSDWILGVVRESVNRKNSVIVLSPTSGYWTIRLMDKNQYTACAGPTVFLGVTSTPRTVGVFVDYEDGLVSFYDADAAALMYSFTGCNFTEKLYPYFNPRHDNDGKNATPLAISSICHAD